MPPQGHHLAIDVGNTRSKLVLFRDGTPVRWSRGPELTAAVVEDLLQGLRPAAIVVGSVGAPVDTIIATLSDIAPGPCGGSGHAIAYRECLRHPGYLGVDRIANAVGAAMRCPGRPVLVIDAGTCITYDLVDASGVFQGGAISPGMGMRALAMHEHSAKLPIVGLEGDVALVATSTEEALRSGVRNGLGYELEGFARDLAHQFPGLVVMVTGGDGPWVASALKNGIFAVPSSPLKVCMRYYFISLSLAAALPSVVLARVNRVVGHPILPTASENCWVVHRWFVRVWEAWGSPPMIRMGWTPPTRLHTRDSSDLCSKRASPCVPCGSKERRSHEREPYRPAWIIIGHTVQGWSLGGRVRTQPLQRCGLPD